MSDNIELAWAVIHTLGPMPRLPLVTFVLFALSLVLAAIVLAYALSAGLAFLAIDCFLFARVLVSYSRAWTAHEMYCREARGHVFALVWGDYCRRWREHGTSQGRCAYH